MPPWTCSWPRATSTVHPQVQPAGRHPLEKGNIPQSIQYYRQSLSLDNRNPATLKNFTVALLKNNDPELFLFYGKSYPQINEFKDKVTALQKNRLPEKMLWQRLLNFSWQNFHPWNFLEIVVSEFLNFPVLLAILLMAAYVSLLKKLFPALGQSIFCSKCGKIIRKMSIEQAQSHALCDGLLPVVPDQGPHLPGSENPQGKGDPPAVPASRIPCCWPSSLFVPGFILNFRDKGKDFAVLFLLFVRRFRLLSCSPP